jgi:hypothetical protein
MVFVREHGEQDTIYGLFPALTLTSAAGQGYTTGAEQLRSLEKLELITAKGISGERDD